MNLFIWLGNKIGSLLGGPPHDPRGMLDEAWRAVETPTRFQSVKDRIAQIKRERASLMAQIAKAEKRHESRAELRKRLAKLTAEQISLERLWECG